MVYLSVSASVACVLLLQPLSSLASARSSPPPLDKRQATTAALTQLQGGPVTYVTTACRTTCASMLSQANAATTDTGACAASTATVTCMNCLLGTSGISAAQAAVVANGFAAYANTCVSEGLLDAVPVLDDPATAIASTSVAALTTSSVSSSASSSSLLRTSTSSAALTTTTALVDSSAVGLTAITSWYNQLGGSCPTECAAVATDINACTTDACICTQAAFTDGQTCQTTCVVGNVEGAFTSAQQQTLAVLWQRAQSACGITASGGGGGAATTTTTRGSRTPTGIPQQSYYAPTVTTSATGTRTGGVISNPTGGVSNTGGAEKRVGGQWAAGAMGLVAVGVWVFA